MLEGNKSYIHIGALKLRETYPTNLFGSRRPREKRHIFLLVLQAEGNKSYRNVGTGSLTEANQNVFGSTRQSSYFEQYILREGGPIFLVAKSREPFLSKLCVHHSIVFGEQG